MTEGTLLWLLPAAGFLFAAGGTWHKAIRRYGLPAALLLALLLEGVSSWHAYAACGSLIAVLSMGYGEGKSWAYRFGVGLGYALPSLFLGWTLWLGIFPCVFITCFVLSNWDFSQEDFRWKVCEFIFGAGIAITFAGALTHAW